MYTQFSLFRNNEFCVLKKVEFVFKNVQELTTLTCCVYGVSAQLGLHVGATLNTSFLLYLAFLMQACDILLPRHLRIQTLKKNLNGPPTEYK